MADNCLICERLALWRAGENPYFIAEFEQSIFVVGDHQFHRGYCVLLYKEHVRDLHELAPDVQAGLFRDLMIATSAVVKTFQPDKMNHASLGSGVPHVHWHIIPRYLSDPFYMQPPFVQADKFKDHLIDPETARQLASKIRANL